MHLFFGIEHERTNKVSVYLANYSTYCLLCGRIRFAKFWTGWKYQTRLFSSNLRHFGEINQGQLQRHGSNWQNNGQMDFHRFNIVY